MNTWEWLSTIWCRLVTRVNPTVTNRTISPFSSSSTTSDSSVELKWKKLRRNINSLNGYDHHDILCEQQLEELCEWYLTIDNNDNAIQIAKNFHHELEKSKLSPSIASKIDTIMETFLNFMPTIGDWNKVRNFCEQVRQENNPLPIIQAYISTKELTTRLNKHLATNTYHTLKFYCTSLNCPVLAETQEYTEAITSLFFHPKFDKFIVRKETVYRGTGLVDKKLIKNYKEGNTIITTTFLSTSNNRAVAMFYKQASGEDKVWVLSIYNINNTIRRTALNVQTFTPFKDEEEILILPYIPFKIVSLERTNNDRRLIITFDECKDE